MSKEKILAKLSDQRKGLKKLNLSMVSDLQTAIEDMKSYDLRDSYNIAFTDYEYALGLMLEARTAVREYLQTSDKYNDDMNDQWASYQEASRLYGEITEQLYSLGIDESPEIEQYGTDLAEGETEGQDAYSRYESDFPDHNELVDLVE